MEIIFIPGLFCTHHIWGEVNTLRNQYICHDANVIQFDTIEKMSANIIDHLPKNDIAVIGISMGGYVAIDLAIKLKDRLKKLILINTTYKPVNPVTMPYRIRGIELARNGKTEEILEMNKGCCYFKPKDEWIALEKEMATKIGVDAYIKQQNAIINRPNYSESIKLIQSETLIIAGKNDRITPYQDSVYMFEQIPHSNLIILDECGHLSTLEKSIFVLNTINNFLEN